MSMTFSEAFRAFIQADTTLANKVKKISPVVIPETLSQADFPALQVKRISGSTKATHDNASGINAVRIEVTWWDVDYAQSEKGVTRIMGLLKTFNGNLGGSTGPRFAVGGFNGPRPVYSKESRMMGTQVDILGLLDEDTVTSL